MSTDDLRRHIARQLDYLRSLQSRGLPPAYCVIASAESDSRGLDSTTRFLPPPYSTYADADRALTRALFHPSHRIATPHRVYSNFGSHRAHAAVLMCGSQVPNLMDELQQVMGGGTSQDEQHQQDLESLSVVEQVCQRLPAVVRALPTRLVERLGIDRENYGDDWVVLLFHLGWHFPSRGIEAVRYRILSATDQVREDNHCDELSLQLGGVRSSPDRFPSVVLSRLGESSDFLTASVNAVLLISEALDGLERADCPRACDDFARLHDDFSRMADTVGRQSNAVEVRVLRLADSFRTPPAAEWAGNARAGDTGGATKHYVLSHLNAQRVVCEVRGQAWEPFLDLADRAGALLPSWPAQQYPAVLTDVASFARYCDPSKFARTDTEGQPWNRGMVTDHRGNVERWLGFVFAHLMDRCLEYLDLVTRPADVTGSVAVGSVNAVLTLRGLNPFAASARAIELAELLPGQPVTRPPLLRDKVPPDALSVATPMVDENEIRELRVLGEKFPMLLKNVDLEVATRLSKQTVGLSVTSLIGKRLAVRPQGDRKGVTVTDAGKAILNGLPKSSADHP